MRPNRWRTLFTSCVLKGLHEREMAKMEALKFNIESNILHMESVGVMMETVSTIKETSHQFQVVSKHVDIARLEGSIEEMFEQRDTSRDIESILNEMHDTHEFDDDELLKELEATLVDNGEDTDKMGAAATHVTVDPSERATCVSSPGDHSLTDGPTAGCGAVVVDALVFPDVPTTALPRTIRVAEAPLRRHRSSFESGALSAAYYLALPRATVIPRTRVHSI